MPSLYVKKANGTKELFDTRKVEKTCIRMGFNREIARTVAQKVKKHVYDDVETRKIFGFIVDELSKFKPSVKYQICLRRGLSLMKPKPDFERFIQILLREHGYEVIPNQIIQGKCVDHEIDAIAKKNGETVLVEVKHHSNYHTPTD